MFLPGIANVNVALQMSWDSVFVLPEEKQAKFVNLKSRIIQGLHPATCFRQDKEFSCQIKF